MVIALPEDGVLNSHTQTDKQTDGHCKSLTESAQWGDSGKILHAEDTESLGMCGY